MNDNMSIFVFMLLATLIANFITKPITASELLIGEWYMFIGIVIVSIGEYLLRKFIKKGE